MAGRGQGVRSVEKEIETIRFLWERPKAWVMDPLKESVEAIAILKLFFLRLKFTIETENELTIEEKLAMLFGVKQREVLFFKATDDFKMPGELMPYEAQVLKKHPSRAVKKDDLIIFRFDERTPDHIDAQLFTKFTDESEARWYRLTQLQYIAIRNKVREVKNTRRKNAL